MIRLTTILSVTAATAAAALALFAATSPALAQRAEAPAQNYAAVAAAFRAFAEKHGVRRGFVIVAQSGQVVARESVGGADPRQPVHLASLSKSITAGCAATLIRDGKLDFTTPLSQALRRFIAASPNGVADQNRSITIEQLITHRSGLAGNMGDGEASTGPGMLATAREAASWAAAERVLSQRALAQPAKRAPGEFRYSNDGYLLLGAVIAETDGRSYEAACRERLLAPAGATGSLARGWEFMSAYGGWSMSGEDYLRVLNALITSDRLVGAAARRWHREGGGRPIPPGQPWYGLGLYSRVAGAGRNDWHTGSWRGRYSGADGRAHSADFNTLAVRAADGGAWFVHLEPQASETARQELDRALFSAYRSVGR